MAPSKPTVLVLGGWQEGLARAVLHYLVPGDEERRVGHLRLVDKFLIDPSSEAYTVYVDPECRRALKETDVEYMQANLCLDDSRKRAFSLDGAPFDWVFDFSGETASNADDAVHIERTAKLIPLLGTAAAGVKAYVRFLPLTYRSSKKAPLKDGEGIPWSARGKWTHEGVRALAQVQNLPLVIVRPAIIYGPYTVATHTSQLLIGEVYKYIGATMEMLWSSDLRMHTIHAHDFAAAMYALARWITAVGRIDADEQAGEIIPSLEKDAEEVKAPYFNVVDEGDTTQGQMAELTGKVIGVKTGFHSSFINQLAKLNLHDVVDEANSKHLTPWPEMLAASTPPIVNSPISPALPAAFLAKNHISFDGTKLRRLTPWTPKYPKLSQSIVQDTVDAFRKEQVWPNAPPRKK